MVERCKYEKWIKQIFLNLLFMSMAIIAMIRGTTLQDLKDIYQTDIPTISYTFLAGSACGIVGSFIMGGLLHKLPHFHFTLLLITFVIMCLSNAVLPHCKEIWLFLTMSGVTGCTVRAANTALNVICLEVWQGENAAPYVHSMYFFFSLGAFLSAPLSKPFLSKLVRTVDEENRTDFDNTPNSNNTEEFQYTETSIGIVYPLLSTMIIVLCSGVMFFSAREIISSLRTRREDSSTEAQAEPTEDENSPSSKLFGNRVALKEKRFILALMMIFFALYMCTELALGGYLPTFALNCDLELSRAEAADVMGITLFAYCLSRLLATFAAIKVRPATLLAVSFTFALIGSVLVIIKGYYDWHFLYVGSTLTGFGIGSMQANIIMWIEQYFPVKGLVASLIFTSSACGAIAVPLLFGNTIEAFPMILPYFIALVVLIGMVVIPSADFFFGREVIRQVNAKDAYRNRDVQRPEEVEHLKQDLSKPEI